MKKLLLIVLLIMCVIVIATPVLAKLKFGEWSKWDERLPPEKYWNSPIYYTREIHSKDTKEEIFWITNLFFCNNKKCSERIAGILFSEKRPEVRNNVLSSDFEIGLIVFPPQKNKARVMVYKKIENKLKFFEEWEIPFENNVEIVPLDSEFQGWFRNWIKEQILRSRKVEEEEEECNAISALNLIVDNKKSFVILPNIELKNIAHATLLELLK